MDASEFRMHLTGLLRNSRTKLSHWTALAIEKDGPYEVSDNIRFVKSVNAM